MCSVRLYMFYRIFVSSIRPIALLSLYEKCASMRYTTRIIIMLSHAQLRSYVRRAWLEVLLHRERAETISRTYCEQCQRTESMVCTLWLICVCRSPHGLCSLNIFNSIIQFRRIFILHDSARVPNECDTRTTTNAVGVQISLPLHSSCHSICDHCWIAPAAVNANF